MRTVLILVQMPAHFREMLRVIKFLNKSQHYKPIVLFDQEYDCFQKDIEVCHQLCVQVIQCAKPVDDDVKIKNTKKTFIEKILFLLIPERIKQKLILNQSLTVTEIYRAKFNSLVRKFLKSSFLSNIFGKILLNHWNIIYKISNKFRYFSPTFFLFWKVKEKYIFYRGLIKNNIISLIIIPGDDVFLFTYNLVNLAKENGINTIVVPFCIVDINALPEVFYNEKDFYEKNLFTNLVAKWYPKWTIQYKDRLLVLPPQYAIGYEWLGYAPDNPWQINSGNSAAIAVESEQMKKHYIKAGLPESKLKVTGSLYDDEIYEILKDLNTKKKDLYKALDLGNEKPIVLCALPPDQWPSREKQCEFKNYEELIEFWFMSLSKMSKDYHIIVNLHPRVQRERVDAIVKKYPICLSDWDVTHLIPLSHIYVASCSATIRVAIGCGIPVINYDVYQYNESNYDQAKGVLLASNQAEFIKVYEQLAENVEYYNQINSLQQVVKKDWSILDGKNSSRMLDLFEKYSN